MLSAGMKLDLQKNSWFTELGFQHIYVVEKEDIPADGGSGDEDDDHTRCV